MINARAETLTEKPVVPQRRSASTAAPIPAERFLLSGKRARAA